MAPLAARCTVFVHSLSVRSLKLISRANWENMNICHNAMPSWHCCVTLVGRRLPKVFSKCDFYILTSLRESRLEYYTGTFFFPLAAVFILITYFPPVLGKEIHEGKTRFFPWFLACLTF